MKKSKRILLILILAFTLFLTGCEDTTQEIIGGVFDIIKDELTENLNSVPSEVEKEHNNYITNSTKEKNDKVIDYIDNTIESYKKMNKKSAVHIEGCDMKTKTAENMLYNVSLNNDKPYYSITDELGRVESTYAETLYVKERGAGQACSNRYPLNSDDTGKDDKGFITSGTDDRGHMIGDQFDGGSAATNINSQHKNTNRKTFLEIETMLRKSLDEGKKVEDFTVIANFVGMDRRPNSYIVSAKINGKQSVWVFQNDGGESTQIK